MGFNYCEECGDIIIDGYSTLCGWCLLKKEEQEREVWEDEEL